MKIRNFILCISLSSISLTGLATMVSCPNGDTYCCPANIPNDDDAIAPTHCTYSNPSTLECAFSLTPEYAQLPSWTPWAGSSYKNYFNFPASLTPQLALNALDSVTAYYEAGSTSGFMCFYRDTKNPSIVGYWASSFSSTYNHCQPDSAQAGFICSS